MVIQCPKCGSVKENIKKSGAYFRTSDSQRIPRYKCKLCQKSFSSATFSPNYNQNKRRLNPVINKLLCSTMSLRRIAIVLGVNRKTVARKRQVLAQQAELKHASWLKNQVIDYVQFDDLETIEHTKLKPVTVTLFVDHRRKILGFDVARIRAKGHLVALSQRKYGIRANEALKMRDKLFKSMTEVIHPKALFESDEHPAYPHLIKKYFPQAEHITHKSIRACIAGQGELKKAKYDPLFKINHTFAMLRANVNRLIRRTWNTTKNLEALKEHLTIYMQFHNEVLTGST